MKFLYYTLMGTVLLLNACNKPAPESGHAHGDTEGPAVTAWSDDYEVYVEFIPETHELEALVHITRLEDYSALQDAEVTVSLHTSGGNKVAQSADMVRSGIFISVFEMIPDGDYHAQVEIHTAGKSSLLDLGSVHFHDTHSEQDEHSHDHDENETELDYESDHNNTETGELVRFTKEQQWAAEFNVTTSQLRDISSTVYAIGTIVPHQHGLSDIVAPVEGFLNINHNQSMVVPGASVRKGDVLATLCPPIGRTNTWTERYTSYQLAENNYKRAQNLKERGAISDTEFEQIEQTYLIEKAGFETLLNAYNISPEASEPGCMHFYIKAPITGTVSDLYVRPGQNVSAGDKMMTLVDPDIVWVRADMYENDFNQLDQLNGATLHTAGKNYHYTGNELELISKGIMVDPDTRTIPVIFRLDNHQGIFRIGQIIQMDIYTQAQSSAVVVPAASVLDQDVQKYVFVQQDGESFEKRPVKTGAHFQDWIAITKGLQPNERIVAQGTYLLKLATITTSVGHAHNH